MRRSIDETLRELPQAMDRADIAPDLLALSRKLSFGAQTPAGGRRWLVGGLATLAALVAIAALVRLETVPKPHPGRTAVRRTTAVRTYAVARQQLAKRLADVPIPVYLPRSIGTGETQTSINGSYRVTSSGYSVTLGYGSKTPLPFNSPKAQFGNAELLMTVLGTGPKGHLDLSQWIPLPKAAPIPNAAQGSVELGHGIVGTTFVGGAGQSTEEAVTWREGGWTFWVGPWQTAEWGDPVKTAAKEASAYLHGQFRGSDGTAVFAAGQDAPSEAVFSIGPQKYAVLALGWRAPRLAMTMAPAR